MMIEIKKVEGVEFLDVVENGERLASIWPGSRVEEPIRRLVESHNQVEEIRKVTSYAENSNEFMLFRIEQILSPQTTVGELEPGTRFTFVHTTKASPDKYRAIDQTLLPKLDVGMCRILYEDKWSVVTAAKDAPCEIVEQPCK